MASSLLNGEQLRAQSPSPQPEAVGRIETSSLSRLPDGQDIREATRESLPSVFLQAAVTAEP